MEYDPACSVIHDWSVWVEDVPYTFDVTKNYFLEGLVCGCIASYTLDKHTKNE